MIQAGLVVVFAFPQTDQSRGKLGTLSDERLQRIRRRVADWISRGHA